MAGGINEPRIHYHKPDWAGLEEVSRNDFSVTFKTRTGTKSVPIRYVKAYEETQRRKNEED
jgi:hypothetical protein